MLELDEIMRQKEFTEQDIQTLKSRVVSDDDPNYPSEALHVYRLNKNIDEQQVAIKANTY